MKFFRFILLSLLIIPSESGLLGEDEKIAKPCIDVVFRGKLRDGVVAIGGETTGTTITAGKITWELKLPDDLKVIAAEFHKQEVEVAGKLQRVTGTEITERWIILTTAIREWSPDEDEKVEVKVQFRGELRTGMVAIGGETTGTVISDDGITWEVDLANQQQLVRQAEQMHKETVVVKGNLKTLPGVERSRRFIIQASELKLPRSSDD